MLRSPADRHPDVFYPLLWHPGEWSADFNKKQDCLRNSTNVNVKDISLYTNIDVPHLGTMA